MTRKDYIKIAEVIRGFPKVNGALAIEFSKILAEDNPRFDRERFYIACGL